MMSALKKYGLVLCCILIATKCSAQQQGFDPSFGNGGIVFTPYMGIGQWNAVALQPDGKILTVGWDSINKIVRFQANGTSDNDFGTASYAQLPFDKWPPPRNVMVLPDSSIIVSGTLGSWINVPFSYYNRDFACVKFQKTGILDSNFGLNGLVRADLTNYASTYPNDDDNTGIAMQSDGKFILCGTDHSDTIEMIRCYSQGKVDSSFGVNGIVKTYGGDYSVYCNAIAIQNDGKILLGGTFSSGGLGAALILRYNTDGSPDTSFNHTGRWEWLMGGNEVSDIQLQPDGKILIAAGISYAPQMPVGAEVILRLHQDGSFDTSFNHTGYLPIVRPDYWPVQGAGWGCHMILLPNGSIVMGGTLGDTLEYSNNKYASLSRCNQDGVPDSSFGINGKMVLTIGQYPSTWLYGILAQPDGKIITAGSNEIFGTSSGGAVLARFMPNGGTVVKEVPQPNGKLSVYPNPCQESISITGYNENITGKIQQLQIINSFGQIVYNRSAPIALGPVNCTPFPPGVYTLIVRGLHYSFNSKFSKQ